MATVSNFDIFEAIKQKDIESVELLLKNGTNPNIQNKYNSAPLFFACGIRKCYNIIKLLLEYGADPNIQYTNGSTALMIASEWNNLGIVKLLLEYGANPNICNYFGWSSLHIASSLNRRHVIMCLIDYGADCNLINSDGNTVFDFKGGNFIREYLESKEHQIVLK